MKKIIFILIFMLLPLSAFACNYGHDYNCWQEDRCIKYHIKEVVKKRMNAAFDMLIRLGGPTRYNIVLIKKTYNLNMCQINKVVKRYRTTFDRYK